MSRRMKKFCQVTILVLGLWIMGLCTFFWPSKKDIASTRIYQDVDVSKIKSGTYMCLSGYFANYDQSPHDLATLRLDYMDKNGKVVASDQTKKRK